MPRIRFLLLLCCLLGGTARAEVTIVTSIQPLALISKAIIGERGQVTSLVDSQQSPHDYAMKPSDRIAIQRANLLVWIDPDFELYLADIFPAQSAQKALITVTALDSIKLAYETTGELDPHLWLNSDNASLVAARIAAVASELDPANAAYFQENLRDLHAEIETAEAEIQQLFADKNRKQYAVYHNAYRYFEDQYGLQHALVLVRNPESEPGGQEIIRVRNSVQQHQLTCLLIEADSSPAIIQTMLGGAQVEQPIMDVLGYNVPADAGGYVTLLRNLAEQFRRCIYR